MSDNASIDPTANDIEAAGLLLDEWKWRHQHCWRLLYRFGLAGLTVALIPYIRRLDLFKERLGDLVDKLGGWELFFPITALIIAQVAVWLFAEEYVRCRPVETMFHRVLRKRNYNPLPLRSTPPPKQSFLKSIALSFRSIGQTTIFIYSALATLISLFNTWLIIELADLPIVPFWFWTIGSIISALLITGAMYLSYHSGEKIKEIIRHQENAEITLTETAT